MINILLAIVSAFVLAVGALTFRSSSEEASVKKSYEALVTSSIMVLIGTFCLVFSLFGLAKALTAAVIAAIVLFVAHTVESYVTSRAWSFENGKLQERGSGSVREPKHSKIGAAKHARKQDVTAGKK